MTDKPRPETDMKEEKKKVAEAKASNNKTINKEKQITSPVKKKSSINNKKSANEVGQIESKAKLSEKEKPKEEKKKPIQKKPVVKKTEAIVNAINLPISSKHAIAICKFIKNKKIGNAISDLEQVLIFKKAVPMKGEIPHRKGKGMMSGRYPKKATEHFIKLLKTLQANVNYNELENPMITEAIANFASRPSGRFGRWKRKRTHVKIIAKEKKELNKDKEDKRGKK